MDQQEFVSWCQEQYERHQIDPTNSEFEDAHYPISKRTSKETIWLHWLDHAVQGLWQSEEEGKVCYFSGDTRAALTAPNYFPLNWFDAWDLYDKWQSRSGKWNAGRRWWLNTKTGETLNQKDCPGDDWINQRPPQLEGHVHWHNTVTGERLRAAEKPAGDEWVRGLGFGSTQDKRAWRNPETGESTWSTEKPGDGWELGHNSRGSWWHRPDTGETKVSHTTPGDGWVKGRGKKP